MKMNERCLPCLINQVVKIAQITKIKDSESLYKSVFLWMSNMDFELTNPEIIGATFAIIKEYIGNDDPYLELRNDYNQLFLNMEKDFENQIKMSSQPFLKAIKYAILGNVIDFHAMYHRTNEDVLMLFESVEQMFLEIDHTQELLSDLKNAKTLMYLGDNCGEICLDKILIKYIKQLNPHLDIYFVTRGHPVVNDSIESDAYKVGIHDYAKIINNGDDSLGTILRRTSPSFLKCYEDVDVVISKGQANYESLSEEKKNIYFLLMVKCEVISEYIGVQKNSLVCMKSDINI